MAEKIGERKVQIGSTGSCLIAMPKSWVTDMNVVRGDTVVILREGESIIVQKKAGKRDA